VDPVPNPLLLKESGSAGKDYLNEFQLLKIKYRLEELAVLADMRN
jgi:hypothetical protein